MRYRRVALLLCLLLATCAKTGENNDVATVIVVTVRGITSDLRVLRAQATLGGVPAASAETFLAAGPAQQFGLSLPPGSAGEYALSVDGITADGCAVSRGATSAPIGGEVRIDLTVELSPLPAPDCASVPVACADEVKDGSETDVDCGGPTCGKCALLKACVAASDCVSGACANNQCATILGICTVPPFGFPVPLTNPPYASAAAAAMYCTTVLKGTWK